MVALAQTAIFVGFFVLRFRWAIGVFVAFLAFSPRSLGLILGGGNFSLTFVRMAFPILIVAATVALLTRSGTPTRKASDVVSEPTFLLLLALAAVKLTSSVIHGLNPLYAMQDALLSAVVFAVFFSVSTQHIVATIFNAVLLSAALTIVIVAIEYPLQSPLHYQIANQSVIAQDLPEARFRDGAYRAQGLFDNPLSLAEFCLYALPFSLAFLVQAGRRTLWFGAFVVLGLAAVFVATGARSGILVGIISLLVFLTTYQWPRFNLASRVILSFAIVTISILTCLSAFNLVVSFANEAQGIRLHTVEDEKLRSTYARALQFLVVSNAIFEHPVIGFGVYQNFARELDAVNNIDNYYLRLGLEAGFVGVVLFFGMLISVVIRVQQLLRKPQTRYDRAFKAMLFGLVASFAFMKLFLSMPTNNVYFYLLMGTALGDLTLRRAEETRLLQTPSSEVPASMADVGSR